MAFPTTSVLDDFNRANGVLGSNWSDNPSNDGSDDFTIISNAAQTAVASLSGNAAWWTPRTFGPDQEAWVDIPTGPSGLFEVFLYLRLTSPSASTSVLDGYKVFITGTAAGASYSVDLSVFRIDNGTDTEISTTQTGLTFTAGNGFGASIVGDTIQAYSGTGTSWSTFGSTRTDSTYSGRGFIGMALYEDTRTATFNNFGGGTIGEGTIQHVRRARY